MERTGHHSTDGIRTYIKRSSVQQQEELSDILSLNKKPRVESSLAVTSRALVPVADVVQETGGSKRMVEAVQTQSNKQLVYNSENLHRMHV